MRLLFLPFLLMATLAQAQNSAPEAVPDLPAPVQAFEPVLEPGLTRALVEFPVYSFYLGSPDINGVAYVPNFSPRLGVHLSWKEIGFTFTSPNFVTQIR